MCTQMVAKNQQNYYDSTKTFSNLTYTSTVNHCKTFMVSKSEIVMIHSVPLLVVTGPNLGATVEFSTLSIKMDNIR